MNTEQIRTQIAEVRDLTGQYGKLVAGRTLTFPQVLEIISYYEDDGESSALTEMDELVIEYKARLNKAQGASGGLTRRINKLVEENQELRNVKANNVKLARIATHAYDLVEYFDKENNTMLDVSGDALTEHPLYVRLRTEVGIEEEEG